MSRTWTIDQLRDSIAKSYCMADVMKGLNLVATGTSCKIIKKYITEFGLDTSHFLGIKESYRRRMASLKERNSIPLHEILIENSTYANRNGIKERLYANGKPRLCEMCGQGELWNGMKISLVLDHINGVNDDNRIENLRVVCPNCNAGLPTFCRGHSKKPRIKQCIICGQDVKPEPGKKRNTCSATCFLESIRHQPNSKGRIRKVDRPDMAVLIEEIKQNGYAATGRKYTVTGNTIKKWLRTAGQPLPKRAEISKSIYRPTPHQA